MAALAEWFVEISSKGHDQVIKHTDEIKKKTKEAEETTKKWDKAMQMVSRGFMAAVAGAAMMVRKGLENTEEGDRLAKAFDRVAEAITNTLLPVIEAITVALEWVADAFDQVGPHGQTAILMIAAAAAALMAILTGGIAPALAAIGLGVGAAINLAQGEDRQESKVTKKAEKGSKSSIEDPTAVFKRIQEKVAGGGLEKENNSLFKQIAVNTALGAAAGAKMKPAVG